MSAANGRVYVAHLVGTSVFDPIGDPVGRVRDVVALLPRDATPTAVGLVVEVPGRRRVFLPLSRVTSILPGQVICTGLVNMRRFQGRPGETLVVAELLERPVTLKDGSGRALVEDVAIEQQQRGRTWNLTQLYVRREAPRRGRLGLPRKGEGLVVPVDGVTGLSGRRQAQGAALLIQAYAGYKPADLATALLEMPPARAAEVAEALNDERLADVLEELPEDVQVRLLASLKRERAADVLEAMEPDDAADLLGDLPERDAAALLEMMEPEDARGVRRLLEFESDVAGGLMTTDPVIVSPESTVATALAIVRREELTPALASMVFVVRPPTETPTGRYMGLVHIQRLLREPPHERVGGFVDSSIEPFSGTDHLVEVSRRMAAYNILAAPVVDEHGRLIGAISVDDVLDHLLPTDWRKHADLPHREAVGDG